MTIVVVGAGIAAVRFVQRLRARGATDDVVLIGAEPHLPYDRPPLSKHVLRGERDLPVLLTEQALAALGVTLRLGELVVGLDPERRQVHTDTAPIEYDVLVIATGAIPVRVPGLDGHVLRTWDDAVDLRTRLGPGVVLAVIGAGLIGCEVAASSRARGAEVHLVDIAPAPMSRVIGTALSESVADLHRGHGVELHLGTGVSSSGPGTLTLGDRTTLAVDVVLHAVGIRPDVAWLAGTGLDAVDGVPCDETGATDLGGVYAIGDVAAWSGRRAEHWTSATTQADRLAAGLTGQEPAAADVPYWWSDQYDVKFQGLGSVAGADDMRVRQWGPARKPLALYGREGRLVAAVGMSAAAGVMRLRADIAAGTPLDEVDERLRTG